VVKKESQRLFRARSHDAGFAKTHRSINSRWNFKIMDTGETPPAHSDMLIELTADVVAAYVSNNPVPVGELPNLIADIHAALGRVGGAAEQPQAEKQKPAVSPKRSVHDDYIICLEDGKKFKSLKRHLMTHYNLTPDQYREKWGLEATYPMVAPNYAAARSLLAKQMGLGRKRKAAR
jgi:predicted transcriptional regulator